MEIYQIHTLKEFLNDLRLKNYNWLFVDTIKHRTTGEEIRLVDFDSNTYTINGYNICDLAFDEIIEFTWEAFSMTDDGASFKERVQEKVHQLTSHYVDHLVSDSNLPHPTGAPEQLKLF